MKEFMLIYVGGDPKWHENTSQEEMAASMARWGAWMAELQEKGQLVSGGSPLHYGGTRLTRDGVTTDITAAEFKELVSGYSIVSAEDAEAAIAIGKACPIFEYPDISMEIREVMNMDGCS